MSDSQQNENKKSNKTADANPSTHSKFDTHQSKIQSTSNQIIGHGYSYVGIQKNALCGYKKHSDTTLYTPPLRTTKSKYHRKSVIKHDIKPNEIEIDGSFSIQEYVTKAIDLFAEKNTTIYVMATGRDIGKAISCIEIIKRKEYGLYQESSIQHNTIKEIWMPLEECLEEVIIEYEVIYFKILLTFDNTLINRDSVGYQQPISWLSDTRQMQEHICKLQNKCDLQEQRLDILQNKYDIQNEDFINIKRKYNEQEEKFMHKQSSAYIEILHKFNDLKKKYDVNKDEFTDMKREYGQQLRKQQGVMNKTTSNYRNDINKLQHKYDIQEVAMDRTKVECSNSYMYVENKYDKQVTLMKDNKHKFDELQDKYSKLQNLKYNINDDQNEGLNTKRDELQCKYDTQTKLMKDNKNKFNKLQDKYYQLHGENNEGFGVRKIKYSDLNAGKLVEIIIKNIDKELCDKYRDGFLKTFIENDVNGQYLQQLTSEDLYELGITNYKDNLSIYNSIQKLIYY
eukprot:440935_1